MPTFPPSAFVILGRCWIGEGLKRNDSLGMLAKGSGSWTLYVVAMLEDRAGIIKEKEGIDSRYSAIPFMNHRLVDRDIYEKVTETPSPLFSILHHRVHLRTVL